MYTVMLIGLDLTFLHDNIKMWKMYVWHSGSLEMYTLYLKCLKRGMCSFGFLWGLWLLLWL